MFNSTARYDCCYAGIFPEHGFTVQPKYDSGCGNNKYRVVWLCIRPQRVNKLQVQECREQDTSARGIKQTCCENAERNSSYKKWHKGPCPLRYTAQKECGQMPESPDNTYKYGCPEWRHFSLEHWECKPPPPNLFYGALSRITPVSQGKPQLR